MRKNKVKTRLLIAGALGVSVACIGLSPALAGEQRSLTAQQLVPALSHAQEARDSAAAKALTESTAERVDRASLRILAADASATYSAAQDKAGKEVCLIVQLNGPEQASIAGCIERAKFAQRGISVLVSGADPSSKTIAHLLPADVDTSSLRASQSADRAAAAKQTITDAPPQLIFQELDSSLPVSAKLPVKGASSEFTFAKFVE